MANNKKPTSKGESKTRTERMSDVQKDVYGQPNGQAKRRGNGKVPTKEEIRRAKKSNDPAWYAKSPEMMTSAGSVNFYQPAGKEINLFDCNDLDRIRNNMVSIPGVLELEYCPGIGVSLNEVSAASIAARSVYNDVRHVQSGHGNYEAQDLMMYILAAANCYAYLFWMRRLYGTIRLFSASNHYMPKALIEASGASLSILDRGFDLYWYIQEYTAKLSAFCYPSGMPLFDRYQFMCDAYYMDSISAKGGLYVFRPVGFWRYDELSTPGKGQLVLERLPGFNTFDFDAIVAFGNKLVGALSDSEDCYIMSGDILKAFGDNIYKIDTIGLDYAAPIKPDLEVLEQIHNATVWGGSYVVEAEPTSGANSGYITQDPNTGAILYRPVVSKIMATTHKRVLDSNRLLTIPTDDAKPEFIMTSSRLMSFGDVNESQDSDIVTDGKKTIAMSSCGTEILTGMRAWYYENDKDGNWRLYSTNMLDGPSLNTYMGGSVWDSPGSGASYLQYMLRIAMFDFHPMMTWWVYDADDEEVVRVAQIMELENYTTVTKLQVDRMHETALLSLFDVPEMGVTVKK